MTSHISSIQTEICRRNYQIYTITIHRHFGQKDMGSCIPLLSIINQTHNCWLELYHYQMGDNTVSHSNNDILIYADVKLKFIQEQVNIEVSSEY